jgi:hypothetical protein
MNGKDVKVKAVSTDDHLLTVWLSDGRVVSAPLRWYPSLVTATRQERAVWQPSGAGRGIHWPALDYDLSVEGIIAGKKEHPNALRYTRETRAKNQLTRKLSARPKRPIRPAVTSPR